MENGQDDNELVDIRSLAKVVMSHRYDLRKVDETLYGGPKGAGLVDIGRETRRGVRDLQEQYLTDRDAFVVWGKAAYFRAKVLACVLMLGTSVAILLGIVALVKG